ncbi:MAG: NmrA family NAD(P)-binding protein, partial [Cellulomonadaceae bacterium]
QTVAAAVEGVDQVLLISGSEVGRRVAQHQTVIDAAARAGVRQLAYTSLTRADTSTLPLAPEHLATERAIAAAGLPATILRNDWYAENYLPDLQGARAAGEIVAGAGDGRVAAAARADYADAAAVVLLDPVHTGQVYELAGDAALSYDEIAAAIGSVIGREVTYRRLNHDEQVAALEASGLDEATAGFVAGLDAGIAAGDLDSDDHTLARLIGRPTTPLVEALRAAD